MCGIAGIVAFGGRANPAAVQMMCDLMAHRGPDGEGAWQSSDGQVALGHRRLAIIDLSRDADQPMADTRGELHITYNGEIYNYLELREQLEALGHTFKTQSDTEVILEAYRAWGDACVEHFNGMFAFAIWDTGRECLFCARDRFGEKPFLYAMGDGFFAFASEYKALLSLAEVDARYRNEDLANFFIAPAHSLDQGEGTLFSGVRQLPAAHRLTISLTEHAPKIDRYWSPPTEAENPSEIDFEPAVTEFRDLLVSSIRLRMRSDVPVGSCLSGGLDSGSIARVAKDMTADGEPYQAFTGRFPGTSADEGAFARAIVEGTNIAQSEVEPTAEGLIAEMQDFVWLNELPVNSASQYAQWCVFKLAKEKGVTVLLDGQGGDEILGGYEQYFAAYLSSRRAQGHTTATEEEAIRARYPLALSMADQSWKRTLPLPARRFASRLLGRGSDVRFGMRIDVGSRTDGAPDDLHAALTADATDGFLTTLLRYGDRNSMAHSREVRLPFCDHRILEFVATMPIEFLMGNAETKRLLRAATKGILPEGIRTRWLKQGFLPPIGHWLKGTLGPFAEEVFNDPAFASDPIWDANWWRTALQRFRRGEENLASMIWMPVIATMWKRHFAERTASIPKVPAVL